MKIRPATAGDAAALARVHVDSWRTTYRGIVPDEALAHLSYERREQLWANQLEQATADSWLKKDFYPLVRCGLFHDGMIRHRVAIENRYRSVLKFDGSVIRVSPNKFLNAVSRDFAKYVVQLKKPANVQLRENFLKRYDLKF